MALNITLLKTPYQLAFTGNPMPFVFAISPYRSIEKAQVIILQMRVLVEDSWQTDVFTEVHSQNIYPDNNGMVSVDIHTLIDPYLKWYTPRSTAAYGVVTEATEQRKRYKVSYLLQQNGFLVGATQESNVMIALKGGMSYENWQPVDFFNAIQDGQPLHFPTKNTITPSQPLFFWWLMPIQPLVCVPVAIVPVTLATGVVGSAYSQIITVRGTSPIALSNFSGPSWMSTPTFVANSSGNGGTITLTGTPDVAGTGETVSFTLSNCSGATVTFNQTMDVISSCVPVSIGSALLPDATVGVAYDQQIQLNGTAPFSIANITGMPSGMALTINGSVLEISGTASATASTTITATVTNPCGSANLSIALNVVNATPQFTNTTFVSSDASTDYETVQIAWQPNTTVVLTCDSYINNNGGTVKVNGSTCVQGSTFSIPIDGTGMSAAIAIYIDGNAANTNTAILAHFVITFNGSNSGSYQTSKVF